MQKGSADRLRSLRQAKGKQKAAHSQRSEPRFLWIGKDDCKPSVFLPLAGKIEPAADNEGHVACNGIAQPEALGTHACSKAQQISCADAHQQTVQKGDQQVQLGIARAVDDTETKGSGDGSSEIEQAGQNDDGRLRENAFVLGKQLEDEIGNGKQQSAAYHSDYRGADDGDPQDLGNAVVFSGAQILTDHGGCCSGEGVAQDADHHVQLADDAGDGRCNDAEGVDPCGDHGHGDADGRRLQSHGNAQREDLGNGLLMQLEAFQTEIEAEGLLVPIQIVQGKEEAEALSDDSGKSSAADAHIEEGNEEDIQNRVHHGCDGNEHERPLGIAHASHDGRYDVVAVDEHQTGDADHRILHGIFIGFGRGVDQLQQSVS